MRVVDASSAYLGVRRTLLPAWQTSQGLCRLGTKPMLLPPELRKKKPGLAIS